MKVSSSQSKHSRKVSQSLQRPERRVCTCADAKRRASAFKQAFNAQLAKLQVQPASYGKLGLGELFEMREECLREFGFTDVYRQACPSTGLNCHAEFFDLNKLSDSFILFTDCFSWFSAISLLVSI